MHLHCEIGLCSESYVKNDIDRGKPKNFEKNLSL
jgi:hypothetical protein